ncbi:hypothetical protein DRO19_03495, partial [Candidatus Bathyarchaeota archaeon]
MAEPISAYWRGRDVSLIPWLYHGTLAYAAISRVPTVRGRSSPALSPEFQAQYESAVNQYARLTQSISLGIVKAVRLESIREAQRIRRQAVSQAEKEAEIQAFRYIQHRLMRPRTASIIVEQPQTATSRAISLPSTEKVQVTFIPASLISTAEFNQLYKPETSQLDKQLQEWQEKVVKETEKSMAEWRKGELPEIEWQLKESYYKLQELPKHYPTPKGVLPPPKSWTEQIAEWLTGSRTSLKKATFGKYAKFVPEHLMPTGYAGEGVILGVVGSAESFVKAGIALATLGFSKEFKTHLWRTLGPPAPSGLIGTAFGEGITAIVSPKKVGMQWAELLEWEKKHPGYIVGATFGDVLIVWLTGKALDKILGRASAEVRGGKVAKLTSAEEAQIVRVKHGQVEVISTLKPYFRTERVNYWEYLRLKEFMRYYTPEKVVFAGERIGFKIPEGIRVVGAESPYRMFFAKLPESIKAAYHELPHKAELRFPPAPFISEISFERTIEYLPKKGIAARIKSWFIRAPSSTIREKLTVTFPPEFTPILMEHSTHRLYTTAQIFGKIDPQVFIDLAKSVPERISQSWFRQMGGLTVRQLSKVKVKVPVVTDIISVQPVISRVPQLVRFTEASAIFGSISAFKPKVKAPTVKLPSLNLKEKINIKIPSITFKAKKPKIKASTLTFEVKKPEFKIKAPTIHIPKPKIDIGTKISAATKTKIKVAPKTSLKLKT